jgi:hypothetical protein
VPEKRIAATRREGSWRKRIRASFGVGSIVIVNDDGIVNVTIHPSGVFSDPTGAVIAIFASRAGSALTGAVIAIFRPPSFAPKM